MLVTVIPIKPYSLGVVSIEPGLLQKSPSIHVLKRKKKKGNPPHVHKKCTWETTNIEISLERTLIPSIHKGAPQPSVAQNLLLSPLAEPHWALGGLASGSKNSFLTKTNFPCF